MLQLVFVHIQADLFAIDFGSQSGVGMAGKAILVLELVLGASRKGDGKQG
jgi:hypothetical protein